MAGSASRTGSHEPDYIDPERLLGQEHGYSGVRARGLAGCDVAVDGEVRWRDQWSEGQALTIVE